MSKLFPNNEHMNNYEGWHYLGSDNQYDYYVLPWSLVPERSPISNIPYLSCVYGENPWEYLSPDYKHMLSGGYDAVTNSHPYRTLKKLLLNNGYHLTGQSDSSDDWEVDSVSDWL